MMGAKQHIVFKPGGHLCLTFFRQPGTWLNTGLAGNWLKRRSAIG